MMKALSSCSEEGEWWQWIEWDGFERYLKSVRLDDVCMCVGRVKMINEIGKIPAWFLTCAASSVMMLFLMESIESLPGLELESSSGGVK